MSTRSLTVIKDKSEEIVVMYRQMDGYPEGHGLDLANFLSDMVIVNGLGGDEVAKVANGGPCLAAQIVAHFKEGPGGIYLHAAGTREIGEEYIYTVDVNIFTLTITVEENMWEKGTKELFKGSAKDMLAWIER